MRILGIESSCDETAAAVWDDGGGLLSGVVASQVDVHALYGGIVPELASREHIRAIGPVVGRALEEAKASPSSIDGIAVTAGPGLVGCLLTGLCFAKSLAFAWGKPVLGVDHLEAHVYAAFLEHPESFPYLALLVSGGHTSLFRVDSWESVRCLGGTLDDAAGEAFDKAAKMLGLPYPGGVVIDRLAKSGDRAKFAFPRPYLRDHGHDFSFSGLKTALRVFLSTDEGRAAKIEDVCASFQEAIVDVLVAKTMEAAKAEDVKTVVLSGGVAANSRLRERAVAEGSKAGRSVLLPSKLFCTDNAAMIALLGSRRMAAGHRSGPELNTYASSVLAR